MKYKFNKRLGFFIRHSKTLSDCRIILNSDLKGENYGRNGSNGICFWDGRSACIHSFDKTNKDLKRKRNSRRELQGTVIHCSNSLSHGGVISNSALKRKYYGRFGSNGFCFRNGRSRSISSTRKTYKNSEAKGNPRRGLQRRIMHCSKTVSDR